MDFKDQRRLVVGATVEVTSTPPKPAKVINRQGARVRVEYSDGSKAWLQIKDLHLREDAAVNSADALFNVIDVDASGVLDSGEFLSFFLPLSSTHAKVATWFSSLIFFSTSSGDKVRNS